MSAKRLRLLVAIGVLLITAVIAAGVILSYAAREKRVEPIPVPTGQASGTPTAGATGTPADNGLVHVDVTVDNVQDVIESLHRPDGYTRNLRIENYYEDDSGGGSAVYDIGVAASAGALALKVGENGGVKHIVIAGGRMYVWYNNDREYRETVAQPPVGGGGGVNAGDEYQMIMTYEDILKIKKEDIRETGCVEYKDEICIYVLYESGRLGYTTSCYVSAASGLLVHAEQYDGARLIYEMTASDYSGKAPDLSVFTLPDGQNAIGGVSE